MKKLIIILLIIVLTLSLVGCNTTTKYLGGTMTIELEPGKKLVTTTWKDSEFWYLVRDMKTDEEPETYEFIEKSNIGALEGKVIIKERER